MAIHTNVEQLSPANFGDFTGAVLAVNKHSSQGDQIPRWIKTVQATNPMFGDALLLESTPDRAENAAMLKGATEHGKPLIVAAGGDGWVNEVARALPYDATLALSGFGNANVAAYALNGRRYRRRPDLLFTRGLAVQHTVRMLRLSIEQPRQQDGKGVYISEDALACCGIGVIAKNAAWQNSEAHRSSRLHGLPFGRNVMEIMRGIQQAEEIKRGQHCLYYAEKHAGDEPPRMTVDIEWANLFGHMAKYVFVDGPAPYEDGAAQFSLDDPLGLGRWTYEIQTRQRKVTSLTHEKPFSAIVYNDTMGHYDGEAVPIPAGSSVEVGFGDQIHIIGNRKTKPRPPLLPLAAMLTSYLVHHSSEQVIRPSAIL